MNIQSLYLPIKLLLFGFCFSSLSVLSLAQEMKKKPDLKEVESFISESEKKLSEYGRYASHIAWVNANFITYDTDWLMTETASEGIKLSVNIANKAKRFHNMDLPKKTKRKLNILKTLIMIPAPKANPKLADELANINTKLSSVYSTGKYLYKGKKLSLGELSQIMETSRDPNELKEIWQGWRETSIPMRAHYKRMVEIANQGAKELGFKDVGEIWRSIYDMDPDQFVLYMNKVWGQVKPLYQELHCYVRTKLNETYGDQIQPLNKPIRADLLGNMWAQSWGNIYPLLISEKTDSSYDLTRLLKEHHYSVKQMFETGESFFLSLGFKPLPETFWERSLFVKPKDREVNCHASAWDIDAKNDIRIKMCTKINEEDFKIVHHELGHNYYQRAYQDQDYLFRSGANPGFHEAIGDMLSLSITPGYLQKLGLIKTLPSSDQDINLLLRQALNKIAFLPFGLLVDRWRWQVFSDQVTPDEYNKSWWELRKFYQGIVPPTPRSEADFDPGAKYHVSNNVPYTRYFIAHILQFQFYKRACELAGWKGPLYRCSFFQSKKAGKALKEMLEKGASQPWQTTLYEFTGTREIDAESLIEYFQPLHEWLKKQNKKQTCGW